MIDAIFTSILVYSIKVFIRETVHIKNSYQPPPLPQIKTIWKSNYFFKRYLD